MKDLKDKVKDIIIESLELEDVNLEEMDDDAPLFAAYDEKGTGLGLDSVDSLEIIVAIKKAFNVRITDENMSALKSVNSLVGFIEEALV